MFTLGINAAFHDSSAVLVCDGKVIAAVEEERFSRIKHAKRPIPLSTYELPFESIAYCLGKAHLTLSNVDYIAYSYDPRIRSKHPDVERLYDDQFLSAILRTSEFLETGAPTHLQSVFQGYRAEQSKVVFVEHHTAHAASAFYPSPFQDAAILTVDGRGESATATLNVGQGNRMTRLAQVELPHSLGILYERITEHLGFVYSSDEGKVMALASYGTPKLVQTLQQYVQKTPNGLLEVLPFELEEVFGKKRMYNGPITQHHKDLASAIQHITEDNMVHLARTLYEKTSLPNLCIAGGVALNCSANTRIRDAALYKDIWIQPAAGDAGTALGAALWVDATVRNAPRAYHMEHAYLGPEYTDNEIEAVLKSSNISYKKLTDIPQETAKLLAANKVVGWFQGRMEFGPRALGSRSILASPTLASMRERLNIIKGREDFRPIAPAILEEKVGDWFEQPHLSPFMLFTHTVKKQKAKKIPSALHVDGTARIQTVARTHSPQYYDTIRAFELLTGIPLILNTSLNVGHEPIVCTPEHALASFYTSGMDALVMGTFLVEKASIQPQKKKAHHRG